MATRHDEEIRKGITKLKREGFSNPNIKADLPGYDKPDPVGKQKFVPDILASKQGKRVIVEVKEETQLENQRDQISTFRRSAAQKPRTEFRLRVYQRGKRGSKKLD